MKKLLLLFLVSGFLISPVVKGFAEEGRASICPQERKTPKAPPEFYNMKNPVPESKKVIAAGKNLYEKSAQPLQCQVCHGIKGNGLGDASFAANPPARNFTCSETMSGMSDGQMFWVIKNGSPGTAMVAYQNLKDEEVWSLIHYIRKFAK